MGSISLYKAQPILDRTTTITKTPSVMFLWHWPVVTIVLGTQTLEAKGELVMVVSLEIHRSTKK